MSSSSQSSRRQDINTNNNRVEENHLHRALWEECAGKLFYAPKEGDQVVYFIQPHIDEVRSYVEPDVLVEVPPNIPAAIHCTVAHVQLMAEPDTDEVVAHLTLVPKQEGDEESSKTPEQRNVSSTNSRIILFTKSLTASDVSTHGGYTIPKPHAEGLLPHMDATSGHAAQTVTMSDLHGKDWVFRHTIRGTPRRHLFSTGWSSFLDAKRLIKGDTLVYLRDENGEYRIGVRRSRKSKIRASAMSTIISGQSLQFGVLATVFHALHTQTMFSVYCRPWRNRSSFIVPLQQYLDSCNKDYYDGARFRISFESDECVERRFTGRIDGTEDLDPVNWPGSKWKCLKVTMDYDPCIIHCPIPDRVSPWEIELLPSDKRKGQVHAPFDRKKLFRYNLGFQGSSSTACSDPRWISEYQGQSSSQGFLSSTPSVGQSQGFGILYRPKLAEDYEPKSENPQRFKSLTLFGKNIIVGIPSEELPSPANTNQSSSRQQEHASDEGCHVQVIKYNIPILDNRSIDLSGMSGYGDLIREIDAMFGFFGSLINGSSGWYMTYVDAYGHDARVGDRAWNEFVSAVKRIDIRAKDHIYGGSRIA